MHPPPAEHAAHNNAAWCDAMCRAHGRGGEWPGPAWIHRAPSPPYYPNLVTLRAAADPDAVLALVDDLDARDLPRPFGVKDSFNQLDLSPRGFMRLFDASWLWRQPPSARAQHPMPGLRWTRIRTDAGLAAWEAAWWRDAEEAEAPARPRLFPARLLADPDVALIAGFSGAQLLAGCAFFRSTAPGCMPAVTVIGQACSFHGALDAATARSAMALEASRLFPDLPLVGYERGAALAAARACGFTEVGPLCVWLRNAADS